MTTDSITDDHIDRSQWLPRTEAMVTPERIAKGDLQIILDEETGAIREAQAKVKNILNYFVENDIVTHEQHDDAVTFQIWRDMHQASMGLRKSTTAESRDISKIKLRAYGYVLIVKRISRYDYRAIELAIETLATELNRQRAYIQRQTYRGAFERLSFALPPIRERIAYLEGLTEQERNEHMEEQLKLFIDGIKKHA